MVPGESVESIVDRGWGLITPNTELLLFTLFGVFGTVTELMGFWPEANLTQEFSEEFQGELNPKLKNFTFTVFNLVEMIRLYSVNVYLATYILLPYPTLTEKHKMLLVPWLLCGIVRSVLLPLSTSLASILLCSSTNRFNIPCLQYSALHGVQFCISLFFWTTVHNFYHYLDGKCITGLEKMLRSIHGSGKRSVLAKDLRRHMCEMNNIEESMDAVPDSEAALVERAAMAWIAREILESGGEYVNDVQFSQFLVIKATMELRQIMNELDEMTPKKRKKRGTRAERVMESLEFCKKVAMRHTQDSQSPEQAFDQSPNLFKRDPMLVLLGKPNAEEDNSLEGKSNTPILDTDEITDIDRQNYSSSLYMDLLNETLNHRLDSEKYIHSERKNEETKPNS